MDAVMVTTPTPLVVELRCVWVRLERRVGVRMRVFALWLMDSGHAIHAAV